MWLSRVRVAGQPDAARDWHSDGVPVKPVTPGQFGF